MKKVLKVLLAIIIALDIFSVQPEKNPDSVLAKFNQNKVNKQEVRLRFVVVSDIHVQARNLLSQSKFKAVLNDCTYGQQPVPQALVVNGDFTNGRPVDYQTVQQLIAAIPSRSPRIIFNIGNHEFYRAYYNQQTDVWNAKTFPNGESDESAKQRFQTFARQKKVFFSTEISGYRFIFLGSENSAITNRKYRDAAFLSSEQLSWLQDQLTENHHSGKPVFVFLHQPLYVKDRLRGVQLNSQVIQAGELAGILRRFPEVIMFSGHLHRSLGQGTLLTRAGTILFNSSSAYAPQSKDGKVLNENSEGLAVEVYDNKLVVIGRVSKVP
ncbi:MAG TPA: metallophosphoesterase [Desulfobacteria bacterium]|nr:metallophosphoesterase [Desulfobacteria bacterium]